MGDQADHECLHFIRSRITLDGWTVMGNVSTQVNLRDTKSYVFS